MRLTMLATAMVAVAMVACNTRPSAVTSFSAQSVSPAPGSTIDLTAGATISIVGPLSIQEGIYYTMAYVRDDGSVFLPGEWGPSSGSSSWDAYSFNQDAAWQGHHTEERFARFCSGGTVTEASFITSTTSILTHSVLNSPQGRTNVFDDFRWNIVNYRVDVPLNYRCQ